MAPGNMRLPLPWICVAAILGTLIASRKVEEAVAVLLSFLMYLLPSERDTLTPTQLVPPAPSGGDTYRLWGIILAPLKGTRPGKTGQWDEAILLDSCPWLHGTLLTLFRRAPSNRRVWRFFFNKRGHSRGLPGGGVKAGAGTSRPFPLRPSAWRCKRGPSWRQPRGARSEASRQAAQRPQPPKVWQADPSSSSVGLCPRRHPVLWRACQSRPRGHLHVPVLHSCSTLGAGPTDQQCANALQSGTPSVMLVGGAINCFWTSPVERAASQRPSKLLDVPPPRPWTSSMVLSMMSRGPLLWTSSWDGWRPALSWASGVALLTLLGLRRGLAPLGLVWVLGGPIAA